MKIGEGTEEWRESVTVGQTTLELVRYRVRLRKYRGEEQWGCDYKVNGGPWRLRGWPIGKTPDEIREMARAQMTADTEAAENARIERAKNDADLAAWEKRTGIKTDRRNGLDVYRCAPDDERVNVDLQTTLAPALARELLEFLYAKGIKVKP